MLDAAIAFITFNRPESTARSFAQIRKARPKQLFLISDAARPERTGESELVQQTRAIAERVDWVCEVHRIYAEENMGCGRRISSGISTAFESVDRLIVLEDDCVPDLSFFPFCIELLERYENDDRVMAISGDNFQQGASRTDASYYFSKYMHCWGWATWRRSWQHFSLTIPTWPAFRDSGGLAAICDNPVETEYWTAIFDKCHAGDSSSWAYPWLLACWMNEGLTVIPDVNLVTNIGFGEDATHTKKQNAAMTLAADSIGQLSHPSVLQRNADADLFVDRQLFSRANRAGFFKRLRRRLGITSSKHHRKAA